MTRPFRVWAPLPQKVELKAGDHRLAMTADSDGWWQADLPHVKPGTDYGFVLDGNGPFPDPRSPWQPRGIEGRSRSVDHRAFPWTDGNWKAPPLASAIIYELHVGTFTPAGTFDAIIEKLDHLAGLGVTHVELMPVNEFSGGRGWGYDGVNLFAPHHAYGGPEGLKRLVDACHAHRLAVILDVVYNHLGPAGNHLGKFAPYFTRHYTSPWGEGINFDQANSTLVRRFFCDNALMWLRDYHFDGLRLDAVHAIFDASAVPFLEQLSAEVRQLEVQVNRPLALIAESDLNDPRLLWERDCHGFGLDAQWNDDFHHALHTVLTGERQGYYGDFGSLADLSKALRRAFVYDGRYSEFRRRAHGRPPVGLNGHRFLAYMQNHDQIGNRALGERSSQLLGIGRLKIAAALVLTSPFIPMLFQGEEWGATSPFLYFTDHQDEKLGEMVRQGRRREFAAQGWPEGQVPDPQSPATFERCKLDWSQASQASHAELLDWHRRLMALRQTEPLLGDGRMDLVRTRFDEAERWFVVERGPFVIACNLGSEAKPIHLPAGSYHIEMASLPVPRLKNGDILLSPDAVAVIKLD